MKANDWKERQEAITELEELIVANPNCLGGSNLVKVRICLIIKSSVNTHANDDYVHMCIMCSFSLKVFDVFNERLGDKNSKVNLHALQAFQNFVKIISHQLQPVLPTLVEALATTLASRYPAIHSAALNAVDLLIESVGEFIHVHVHVVCITSVSMYVFYCDFIC